MRRVSASGEGVTDCTKITYFTICVYQCYSSLPFSIQWKVFLCGVNIGRLIFIKCIIALVLTLYTVGYMHGNAKNEICGIHQNFPFVSASTVETQMADEQKTVLQLFFLQHLLFTARYRNGLYQLKSSPHGKTYNAGFAQ